jgi:HSP20 family protein
MAKRIKPVSRIGKIQAEIDRIFCEALFQKDDLLGLDESWIPYVDLTETSEEIIIKVEMPGVLQKDVTLLLHSNKVEVKGIKKENLGSQNVRYLRLEREYGPFRRIIYLPAAVLSEGASAILEGGVLTIRLKKFTRKNTSEVILNITKDEKKLGG